VQEVWRHWLIHRDLQQVQRLGFVHSHLPQVWRFGMAQVLDFMGGKGSGRPEPAPRDSGGQYKSSGCFSVIAAGFFLLILCVMSFVMLRP